MLKTVLAFCGMAIMADADSVFTSFFQEMWLTKYAKFLPIILFFYMLKKLHTIQ